MAKQGLGVTIGSHTLRAVQLRHKKKKDEGYIVTRVFSDRIDETTRPVAGLALSKSGFRGTPATMGLSGRDVIIRYTQVPPVPEWRLRTLMKFEVEEVSQQSGGDVSADYRALDLPDPDGTRDEETILVALARNKYLDKVMRSLASGGLKMSSGVPNSVALFNAFAANATYTDDETALLVNVGAENVDIAIQQGGELIFARNATPAGQAYTDAIKQSFNTSQAKAEKMKKTKGDVTPKGQAKYPDPTSEKVANAIMGVAGQMASMIQSSLMIARAQTRLPDLKIDRVLLSGGGASLKGLDLYLQQALDVPVEHFNPFVFCDTSGLSDEEQALIEAAPHEFTVAVGLAQNDIAAEALGVEVLPASLKRARDFATKGVFSIAAAVVMVAVLFLLYNGRSAASADFKTEKDRVVQKGKDAVRADAGLRKVLGSSQDAEVKHRLLADLAQPGILLTNVIAEVEENITPFVYIESIDLKVRSPTYSFDYYKPKTTREGAKGYVLTVRSRSKLRLCEVLVKGRISHGQNTSKVAGQFISLCKANKRGLTVETTKLPKEGSRGRDGTFEIKFVPGVTLLAAQAKATPTSMHSLELGDQDGNAFGREPDAEVPSDDEVKFFVGYRPDGVQIQVPVESVKPSQRKKLIKDKKAAMNAK